MKTGLIPAPGGRNERGIVLTDRQTDESYAAKFGLANTPHSAGHDAR